ncbi:MAG TPA: type IV toxin-antitoxin system AbiEi family antitoxin domain-containing protein [Solirubrobacterales bacterium]|nr:type IV toxin-antitoxin system AbiEi family antitoxin domain-containing protein [Solirubrobacterales bacterium]
MASRAHGVVTRSELLVAGLSPEEIRKRLKRGTLIRVHRGVYRVGHAAPSREATYLAAVKAGGPGALLAGRAAAHLWSLLKGSPPPPEVTAPTDRRVKGVFVHRARRGPAEATQRHGIPVTTVPRTLVDLASSLPVSALSRACHEASVLHDTTPADIERILARRQNSTGADALRRVVHGDEPVTLSALERRFLIRLRDAGLPRPEVNRRAGGRRVDCRWPDARVTVELDGYRYHRSRHAWELDRRREREARARGDELRRYTYGDVFENPRFMLSELRALLRGVG